jgi:trimethylamine--corrinoid protein Co-methyltransferase
VGGSHLNFAVVGSAPNVSDLERGRRPGSFADFCDLLRLGQSLNALHLFTGYPVEPVDLPPETRHLDCLRAFVTLPDKCFHGYSLGRERILDALEITRLARAVDEERFAREPSLFSVINSSSPLRIDGPMLEGMIELARRGQVCVVTPFTLAGAMAPATLAGALAQQNAEALAGIAFAQLVRAGAPVVYGGFTSNVDMRSGAPAFGTPEYALAALAGGQLARRYRLPYRSSNVNAANVVDAQAAYESQMSLWPAVLSHANLVMHAGGWMEGGLTASFEKMVIDAEMLQMLCAFLAPIVVDEDTLAVDVMLEVGHGGHFFGASHTLSRYRDAFNAPLVSDWSSFERWHEAGGEDTARRAHRIWRALVDGHEPPPLGTDAAQAVDAYVERRRRGDVRPR